MKKSDWVPNIFAPIQKYCFPKFGGLAHENIEVLGLHRTSRKFIKIVIQTKRIKNFRLKKVFSKKNLTYLREDICYKNKPITEELFINMKSFTKYLNSLTEEILDTSD